MQTDTLWEKIKDTLAVDSDIDNNAFKSYIASSELAKEDEMSYFVVARSSVGKNFVMAALPKINEVIKRELGHNVNLNVLGVNEYNEIRKTQTKAKKTGKNIKSFDNFVVGNSNKKAFKATNEVSEELGSRYNPLFIYGDSGLGKTHLLKAAQNQIEENFEGLKCYYVTAEKFGNEAVDVILKGYHEIEAFKEGIMQYDVLLIDDIQFLKDKDKTNEILFSIFNYYLEENKQIIITSDKGPEDLNGFDKRIITRLNYGLSVDIQTPDVDTARHILDEALKDTDKEWNITNEALDYIASYYASDVRKIQQIVNRFGFYFDDEPGPITLSMLQEKMLDGLQPNVVGKLNSNKIKDIVGDKYGVSRKQIEGKTRTSVVTNARHVAMYLTKDILNISYVQIGHEFGGKDHTTVLNAVNKIQDRMDNDKDFKKVIMKLKNDITTN
ncbi:chromosomal replication initiator protein DnaA [Mesoplasma lactucae]|uniref:Chromosomal replication initiator protein DnaA n=1 Tax=Mesoplasma lactucae ATCC 49193 TaxID=81460 RepID=A0A291ISP2_9MOLU|nr:chromosomal replication initiator protein DnaA [Mesoplasma lactucae]ATG97707.1 chromosomal replication initiator protein DnaA [Mesoplasma lactucae ATCC 49193]ATZ19826.1 chromosomal replication initiator protein DnaA [Mesoplasma lactucae ATCC 49193]MCL8216689.1 Chromosomal replication initiator protein DnaA [Mesoplasma lactucae ATCC 49193]